MNRHPLHPHPDPNPELTSSDQVAGRTPDLIAGSRAGSAAARTDPTGPAEVARRLQPWTRPGRGIVVTVSPSTVAATAALLDACATSPDADVGEHAARLARTILADLDSAPRDDPAAVAPAPTPAPR